VPPQFGERNDLDLKCPNTTKKLSYTAEMIALAVMKYSWWLWPHLSCIYYGL